MLIEFQAAILVLTADVAGIVGGVTHRSAAAVARDALDQVRIGDGKLVGLLDGHGGFLDFVGKILQGCQLGIGSFAAAPSATSGKCKRQDYDQEQ